MSKISNPARWLAGVLSVGALLGACERTTAPQTPEEREVRQAAREVGHATGQVAREAEHVGENVAREAERVAARVSQDMAPGPTTMAFTEALQNIASARCDREQRCNNVGQGRRYESAQTCHTVIRNDFADDLNPSECTAGIDRNELSECMREIRNEDCDNPIDSLERVAACRTSDLCRNVPPSPSVGMR